ncbi:hypothetical protein LCGC14_2504350, partial [marine sediment metagenome]
MAGIMSDPALRSQFLMALGSGLLSQSGPSAVPQGLGVGLGQGMQQGMMAVQNYQRQQQQKQLFDLKMAEYERAQEDQQRQASQTEALRGAMMPMAQGIQGPSTALQGMMADRPGLQAMTQFGDPYAALSQLTSENVPTPPGEQFTTVQDPYGFGGAGQESSLTGKITGYQSAPTAPKPTLRDQKIAALKRDYPEMSDRDVNGVVDGRLVVSSPDNFGNIWVTDKATGEKTLVRQAGVAQEAVTTPAVGPATVLGPTLESAAAKGTGPWSNLQAFWEAVWGGLTSP